MMIIVILDFLEFVINLIHLLSNVTKRLGHEYFLVQTIHCVHYVE